MDDSDEGGDVTGYREWDGSRLLLKVLTDATALKLLLPSEASFPPDEVLELGAGTGDMACSLASRWSGVRYVATDLPRCVPTIRAKAAEGKFASVHAEQLFWGNDPPAPTCGEDATYLVLMSELIHFTGISLLEPDTLEPLANTLNSALSSRCRAFAIFIFRERELAREAKFRSLCVAHGLTIEEPLDDQTLAGFLPTVEQSDEDVSGKFRLWCISKAVA
eukprot:TRINITY_DN23175_c0_g2_i1.p1 TRINITY_DN23175_c0_g2~~TRINITY_DN23175_c0_g2_i1.p1  ORF type:complete len:220 (+),score=30.90 TRINITY_DN23175_c0_g2_i1:83-742(+)